MTYKTPSTILVKFISLTSPRKYRDVEVDEFLTRHKQISLDLNKSYVLLWTTKEVVFRSALKLERIVVTLVIRTMID